MIVFDFTMYVVPSFDEKLQRDTWCLVAPESLRGYGEEFIPKRSKGIGQIFVLAWCGSQQGYAAVLGERETCDRDIWRWDIQTTWTKYRQIIAITNDIAFSFIWSNNTTRYLKSWLELSAATVVQNLHLKSHTKWPEIEPMPELWHGWYTRGSVAIILC
jgi:hypothetical protein